MGCISQNEFLNGCQSFQQLSNNLNDKWKLCYHEDSVYLMRKFMKMFKNEDLCIFECHVIYSESYACPVFYFLPFSIDGKMLTLEKCWNLISNSHKHLVEANNVKWSFMTQTEHPIQLRPFYHLHPCHTKDFMKNVQNLTTKNPLNYIISWLSTVLQVLELDFPLEAYCKLLKNE